MARPREFDPQDALAGALNVFWKNGYEEASLPDLLEGMNLTRGSFYKAFKDKKSLFLSILERYEKEEVEPALSLLENRSIKDGIERVEFLLNNIISAVENGDRRGCLLCSTIAAPAVLEKDVAVYVERTLARIHQGFTSALEDSAIHPENLSKLAHMLISHYVGLRVLIRAGVPVENLKQSTHAILLLLKATRS